MAYVFIVANCWNCGKELVCNPLTVPSHDNTPICRDCVREVNLIRKARGFPQFVVPADAYEAAETN